MNEQLSEDELKRRQELWRIRVYRHQLRKKYADKIPPERMREIEEIVRKQYEE